MVKPQLEPVRKSSLVHSSICSTGRLLSQSGIVTALPSSDCPYSWCYLMFTAQVNNSSMLSTGVALLGCFSDTPGDTAEHKCRDTCNFFAAVKTSGQVLVWGTQTTGKPAWTISETAGGAALNKILPFSLKGLYLNNQTPPECSQRSPCESEVLNNLTAKCLTTPSLGLTYTASTVFSSSKIQIEEKFPQRRRVCLPTRQGSWGWECPKFAIALRWNCPNYPIFQLLKEDWKIIKHWKS